MHYYLQRTAEDVLSCFVCMSDRLILNEKEGSVREMLCNMKLLPNNFFVHEAMEKSLFHGIFYLPISDLI